MCIIGRLFSTINRFLIRTKKTDSTSPSLNRPLQPDVHVSQPKPKDTESAAAIIVNEVVSDEDFAPDESEMETDHVPSDQSDIEYMFDIDSSIPA